jgi:predicted RNA-binding Zn-ribbon protein involved in translation (DUF1610 family)
MAECPNCKTEMMIYIKETYKNGQHDYETYQCRECGHTEKQEL